MPTVTTQLDNLADALQAAIGQPILRNEPLSKYNSLRVGGPADLFVEVQREGELICAVRAAREQGIPYLVIGNGTNLIFTDAGIRGLVIRNRAAHFALVHEQADTSKWFVESGTLWGNLCRETAQLGWGDITWGISIPGSLGGAIVSNAGAHGGEIKDVLIEATVLDAENKLAMWPVAAFALAYRSSILKAAGQRMMSPSIVVTSLHLQLQGMDAAMLQARMKGWQRHRIASQPAGKTAGSTFKNPPGDSAGRLLEAAGLKGYRYGAVEFSPKHANFLMNLGDASYAEVRHILSHAQQVVYNQFGVQLEPEVEIVGEEA